MALDPWCKAALRREEDRGDDRPTKLMVIRRYKAALLREEDRDDRSSNPRTNARPGQAPVTPCR